jgi:gamma-tubulin complex component 5
MATTATLNKWLDELASSLLPTNVAPTKARRLKAQFNRKIRHHSYGRTNQFDVEERLTGLEEKFQILDHDDLSDAIHARREELRNHQEQWIPDVLDFVIRMSKEPLTVDSLAALQAVELEDLVTLKLKWADVERDDPIDRRDRIWRQPDFSDSSEDEGLSSSAPSSPASPQKTDTASDGVDATPLEPIAAAAVLDDFQNTMMSTKSTNQQDITEIQTIREVLHMLQDLPTALFQRNGSQIRPNPDLSVSHMSRTALESVLSQAILVWRLVTPLRSWSLDGAAIPHTNVLTACVADVVHRFDESMADHHREILKRQLNGGVCSLLEIMDNFRDEGRTVLAVAQYVSSIKNADSVTMLEVLFEQVCYTQLCGNIRAFELLVAVFCKMLAVYCQPLAQWIEHGIWSEREGQRFVQRTTGGSDKSQLWHAWFIYTSEGPERLPSFLQPFARSIFVAGKTMAFVNALKMDESQQQARSTVSSAMAKVMETMGSCQRDTVAPFGPTLLDAFSDYVNTSLNTATTDLQHLFAKHCDLLEMLDATSHLYLSLSPRATSDIDNHLFDLVDRGRSSWNDQYVVADVLAEAFQHMTCVDAASIGVQAESMHASAVRDQRDSVKILEKLALTYRLPWPIANIMSTDTMASYRRVSLMLAQIRRAKYVLEKYAWPSLKKHSSSTKISPRGIVVSLLLFANMVHAHLMHCVITPMSVRMRTTMTGPVDNMIVAHKSFTDSLERACLTARNLKVLRETLHSLLDLSINVGFLLAGKKGDITDFALSNVKTQFRKHINLFIAGLKGSARASGMAAQQTGADQAGFTYNVSESLELLAASLEGASFKM